MDVGGYHGVAGKRALNDDDGGERNGRQKKRSGATNDRVAQAEETVYRILCPVNKIGSLIGKGGSIIKALRAECRSSIKVEDPVSGSDERVVIISSSSDQFGDRGYYACAAQEALFKVYARITEAEDDDEPPQPVHLRLLVSKSNIGCLLGKGGKIIEQMRKDIGAQIRILPKDQHPPSASATDELVQVTGDASLVRKALFEISTRLYENVSGERTQRGAYMSQGSDRTTVPMFARGSGGGNEMYPPGGYLGTGSYLAPTILGGAMQGLAYSYGGLYGDIGMRNAWGLSMPSAESAAAPGSDGTTEEEFILRVLCPNSRIGSVIGKGGSVIKKMREETGAKIRVEDQIPDCDERVILISAAEFVDTYPSPAIEAVMQVFRRLAELHADKDMENKSFSLRLLVPSTQIGCLLGKGGSIVTEMRKATRANIRISPKDDPSKCAEGNDELVQVTGDQSVVQEALFQILNRLRSNLFKGHDGRDSTTGFGSSMYPGALYGGSNMFGGSFKGGAAYSHMNMGYQSVDYGYGGINSGPSFGKEGKSSRPR